MNKKIEAFQDGDSLVQPLLVQQMNKGVQSNGASYLSLTLQDNSGTIEAKMWDVKEDMLALLQVGKIYVFKFDVLKYRNALQARVNGATSPETPMQLQDFVSSSAIPVEEMKRVIKETISSIENQVYKSILVKLFTEYSNDFFEYPAASKNHHSFIGGLAEHVIGMIKVADSLCVLYPYLNRDLLISGVLVHDLGKLIELSGAIATEYTLEGKLLGHISIMQAKIFDIACELELQDKEETVLLRHMVLSHHGKLEYGSPVVPLLMEAEVLNLVDNLDARLNTLTSAFQSTEAGNFTSRVFALENRAFYKPKND